MADRIIWPPSPKPEYKEEEHLWNKIDLSTFTKCSFITFDVCSFSMHRIHIIWHAMECWTMKEQHSVEHRRGMLIMTFIKVLLKYIGVYCSVHVYAFEYDPKYSHPQYLCVYARAPVSTYFRCLSAVAKIVKIDQATHQAAMKIPFRENRV